MLTRDTYFSKGPATRAGSTERGTLGESARRRGGSPSPKWTRYMAMIQHILTDLLLGIAAQLSLFPGSWRSLRMSRGCRRIDASTEWADSEILSSSLWPRSLRDVSSMRRSSTQRSCSIHARCSISSVENPSNDGSPPRFAFCEVTPSDVKQLRIVSSMFAVRVFVEIVQILPNFD